MFRNDFDENDVFSLGFVMLSVNKNCLPYVLLMFPIKHIGVQHVFKRILRQQLLVSLRLFHNFYNKYTCIIS